jgi:ERCC4-type nuclease
VRDEANRKEVDLLIDDKIAIEIKNFVEQNPEGEVTRLLGQISRFAPRYEAYIVVIFGGSEYHKNEIKRSAKNDNVITIIKN